MIHLNTLGIRHSRRIINYLKIKLFYPPVYWTMSVFDFLDSREEIKPASRFNLKLPEAAIIRFQDINLRLIERGFEISDLTAAIEIGDCPPRANRSAQRKNLSNGKYSWVSMAYYPETEYTYLIAADQPGPPASETSTEAEPEKVLKVSFIAS